MLKGIVEKSREEAYIPWLTKRCLGGRVDKTLGKTVSITVHPSVQGGEYLTVSDAMRQVLDLVEAIERTESTDQAGRRIVWRLTDARTNSPPFTVEASAFSVNPTVSLTLEVNRLVAMFDEGLRGLLDGQAPDWMDGNIAAPLKRLLNRNLNGIGRTQVAFDKTDPVALDSEAAVADYSRTEYGSIEVDVCGIGKWNNKPALHVVDRLSSTSVSCVLTEDLADQLGPSHRWDEAWEGKRLLVLGAIHYGSDGRLTRIDAESAEEVAWTDVSLADLRGIDILEGRSVSEHLRLMRGDGNA
jgi:hypothetical protein